MMEWGQGSKETNSVPLWDIVGKLDQRYFAKSNLLVDEETSEIFNNKISDSGK